MKTHTVRSLLVLTLAIGLVAGGISLGSALFTDSQAVDANAFTSGTLELVTDPTTALISFSNMAPGDDVNKPVTVTNNGSLDLRYAVSSTATDADSKNLMGQLDLTVYSGVSEVDCNNGSLGGGTIIYGPADLGSIAGINLVGDPAAGADTGDRQLAASASEVLCFYVELPISTGNEFAGAATTATFTFAAEQTTNNP